MKLLLLILIALLLTGCADRIPLCEAAKLDPVGFWYGWWHGEIFPFAWFVSLFDRSVSVYAVYNNGGWYDFGFLIGVSTTCTCAGKAAV